VGRTVIGAAHHPSSKENSAMNMRFYRKLPLPIDVKAEYPVSPEQAAVKAARDREIAAVFRGESDRFLLIVGPCSADNREAVLDYVGRLRRVQDRVADRVLIIPRIYTNKPRTTGAGYKGMLHQPDPGEKPDMLKGIVAIRELYLSVLRDYGFGCADEMLYPENHRYMSDLLSYVAVGARSSENQQHRLTASGLDIPVGMKNPTGGDISVMLNSITAAQHGHTFLYRGWECRSSGNPLAHAILRGYVNRQGETVSNYHSRDILALYGEYAKRGLANPALIIDANHANSGKKPFEQSRICKEVISTRHRSSEAKALVKGFMIESYIEDGSQSIGENCIYGKSITDPCLGWEKTERLIYEIAELI
jgi:3-deoxy-7-phosphoheptulonate synthase